MNIRIVDFRPPKIAQALVLAAVLMHWATPLKKEHEGLFMSYVGLRR